MIRLLHCLAAVLTLSACADGARQLDEPVAPLGDFDLGHAIVVAPNLVKGPLSRELPDAAVKDAVTDALQERFRRFDGARYYHLGVSVEGYVLAQPGVPLVFTPKSVLILQVTVWDDARQAKLNAEPERFTVLESVSADTVVGSGLTRQADAQMRELAANAALQIERWMRRQQRDEGWFGGAGEDAAAAASDAGWSAHQPLDFPPSSE